MKQEIYRSVTRYENLIEKVFGTRCQVNLFPTWNAYRHLANDIEGVTISLQPDNERSFANLKKGLIKALSRIQTQADKANKEKISSMIIMVKGTVMHEGIDAIIEKALEVLKEVSGRLNKRAM